MSDGTAIEWTDATWNPTRGCTRISPGCVHCYAERFAERFRGVSGHPYQQGFDLRLVPDKLGEPFSWNRPRRVFVNSMSDLFHRDVPTTFIRSVVEVMRRTPWHTYQVLTKRSARLQELLNADLADAALLENVWWGVSVENKLHGLPRVDQLRATAAHVRFLSVEPLLEDLGEVDLRGVHWIIVGGESGPGARPLEAEWVRSLRDQCRDAGVAFFFKQWGGVQKSRSGRSLDDRTHDEQPPWSAAASVPTAAERRVLRAEFEAT